MIYHNIMRLYIAMHDSLWMAVVQCLQQEKGMNITIEHKNKKNNTIWMLSKLNILSRLATRQMIIQ